MKKNMLSDLLLTFMQIGICLLYTSSEEIHDSDSLTI